LTAGWLEAFKGRGNADFLVSHGLENVVTVVDGRPALIDELPGAAEELRTYIATEISSLLSMPQFLDALPGHLPGDSASQSRVPLVINMLEALTRWRMDCPGPTE
jgi:hypothetical protein